MDEADSSVAAQVTGTGVERRVIRDAELVLEVSDVNRSVRHARELAGDYGGYTQSSTTRMLSEDREAAELTLEVPSADFDGILDALRDGPYVVRVDHESTSSRDVTEEFVDLQSRLGNLEATEIRFVALLDEAGSIDEILSVEREISRIRGEIEQIQGRINYLEQRTDFSRIHVMFYPEEDAIHIAGKHFTPGETAREAWDASMQFMGAIGNAIVAVSVFFWWAWPFVIAAGVSKEEFISEADAICAEANEQAEEVTQPTDLGQSAPYFEAIARLAARGPPGIREQPRQ
jgi:hypothetical protein